MLGSKFSSCMQGGTYMVERGYSRNGSPGSARSAQEPPEVANSPYTLNTMYMGGCALRSL
jgi:hypothetical protein